jgi:putative DNA methylase
MNIAANAQELILQMKKKLIEVALPLEAINMESAREKSIRHGHPSTLHLWWARRPLAACRAILWASLVDDPSSWPDKFPTEEEQNRERQRLFDILGRIVIEVDKKGNQKQVVRGLVSWDEVNDPKSKVLEVAQREIARCLAWDRGEEPPTKPDAVREYIAKYAPPAYDPFAGGGSIPLEAQRLGLEAHASDLNPVAVLINKALIEIPPKFKDQPPINPEDRQKKGMSSWEGAQGLAADVRYYGKWMRDEAFKQIGHLYPKVEIPPAPLDKGGGKAGGIEATVIAWLWARTVKCPNPACGCQMPLVRSFQLSTKKGKEAWVETVIDRSQTPVNIEFQVQTGKGKAQEGTVERKGSRCIACETPVPFDHVRSEGRAGRMGQQLMAIVAEGQSGRIYLAPNAEHEAIAASAQPTWQPDTDLPEQALGFRVQLYGMTKHADLFTLRQLVALTTFSDLVEEAREKAIADAVVAGIPDNDVPLNDGGTGARAYGDAIATYLSLCLVLRHIYKLGLATASKSAKVYKVRGLTA